jgi:hypothetical protein
LLVVAAIHLARVWTCHQTPWKGGGFGMFSTVDQESARFVRAYLITDDGQRPLSLPPATAKLVGEIRAAPTKAKLTSLATVLAEQNWQPSGSRRGKQLDVMARHGGADITAAMIAPKLASRALADQLEPMTKGEPQAGAVSFQAVQVECLRYRFDRSTHRLSTEPLLAVTAAREEGAP